MKVLCKALKPGVNYLTVGKVYTARETPQGWELWDDEGDELDCRQVDCRHAEWQVVMRDKINGTR